MHYFTVWLAAALLILGLATTVPTLPDDLPDPEPQGGGAGDPDG